MADSSQQSRTEAATPRRREEAQKRGQFAKSADLSSGLVMLAGVLVLWLAGEFIAKGVLEVFQRQFASLERTQWDVPQASQMTNSLFNDGMHIIGPLIAAVTATALLAGVAQVGFSITFQPLEPKWDKASPIKGFGQIFSQRAAVRGALMLLKAGVVLAIVAYIIQGRIAEVALAGGISLWIAVNIGWEIAITCGLAVATALVAMGLIDYLFQYWKHEQDLRMSRDELKEEVKRNEGDPHMRARQKKIRRETLKLSMLQEVPKSTVILSNPTHISVALKYDRNMPAPVVVAKATGALALRIRKIAAENGVPVLERKPLARALFAAVDVGDEVPQALYQAVAEIIAYIYGLRAA